MKTIAAASCALLLALMMDGHTLNASTPGRCAKACHP
jgi:hypothetical protein